MRLDSFTEGTVLSVSASGSWLYTGGQLRHAFYQVFPNHHFDGNGDQLFAAAGGLEIGLTGQESAATHQNPFAVPAKIVRSARALLRMM